MTVTKHNGGSRNGHAVPDTIVREAIRLFGEKSYPVVGMRDLSKAVGVQPGSLYAHISSKEALLMAIVEEGITNYIDAITSAIAIDDGVEARMRAAVRAHMRVLAGTTEQTKVTFGQWHFLGPENRERVVKLREQYETIFLELAQEGIATDVFRPVPHLKATLLGVIGGLTFAAEWYSPAKSDSPDGIADAISDVLIRGLRAEPTAVSASA